MGLHVYVKFGTDADFTEITSYVRYNSVKFDIKLMNDKFKSVQDSVKMQTIYDATLNARFFESTAWIPAYITYDLQTEQMYGYEAGSEYGFGSDAYGFLTVGNVFTGAIYPTTKDTYKSVPTEGVSFEIVDNSYLLEVDCPAFTYQGLKVFDPADTSHSIIHQLLYSAGLSDADISSLNAISKTLGYISYEAKDETIDKIIDELLYEYHHTYYFNEDGQFCLYDWKHDSITIADTITDAVIKDKDGIKRERNIYEFDGYLVKYNELLSKTDALIYREDIPAEGNLLIPSQAFPVDGEIKTIKQSYSNKWLSDDAKILLTSNHALTLTADAGITKPVETFENLEAQVVIKNTDLVDHRFYQFDIRADVVYTDKENEFTIPTTATLTDDDMELEHVYNDADALEFANALYNNTVRYGLHTYEFKSEASFEVGLCYELEHYSVNVLIIGKKYNQYEHIFEYECLSVGAQVVETPDVLYRLPSGTGGDAPSRYLALEADFNSIDVSARGAILVPTITFKARVLGIPISEVSWSRSDAGSLGLVGGNDYLRTLDTSTVAGGFVTITITATYGGTAYNATYTVKKVYNGMPAPMKLPMATTETPKETLDGEPLVAGDYFVVGAEFVEASVTYKVGTLWEYTGSSWVLSSDKMKALNAMGDFTTVASEAEDGVFCRLIAKEIYAQSAVIEEIGTKEITVKEDGSVGSEDFAEDAQGIPTSGYMLDNPLTPLGRRGRVRAHGGIFNNTTIYGSIIHDALVTRKSAPTTPVTFPSKTAWNRKDFWNALSVTENSADMIAADLNIGGTAYSYIRKITSATFEKQIVAYARYNTTNADSSEYYTSYGKGNIRVNAVTIFGIDDGNYVVTSIEIYVDGVKVANLINPSEGQTTYEVILAVNKSSTIRVRRLAEANFEFSGTLWSEYSINWRGIQNSLQVSNVTTSWDTIEGMASDYLARGRWQCSSPITFDSNNILNYALANTFIAGFSSLPEGVEIQADNSVSKVTYGGLTNQPVTSVINYGSSIRLNYTGGHITFVAGSNADGSFTGWYNASASVSVLSKEGIVTSNIIPKDTTREIGEFDNPFLKGYIKQLIGETLSLSGVASVASINTGGLGAFLIGQNLRTTDSPTFAGINTGYGNNEVYRNSYVSINMTGYVQLGSMEFGETRHVHVTTSGTSIKRLLLPSGYSYLVWGIIQTYDSEWGWGSASFSAGGFNNPLTPLAGGYAIIAQGYYDNQVRWQFLIRRIS